MKANRAKRAVPAMARYVTTSRVMAGRVADRQAWRHTALRLDSRSRQGSACDSGWTGHCHTGRRVVSLATAVASQGPSGGPRKCPAAGVCSCPLQTSPCHPGRGTLGPLAVRVRREAPSRFSSVPRRGNRFRALFIRTHVPSCVKVLCSIKSCGMQWILWITHISSPSVTG